MNNEIGHAIVSAISGLIGAGLASWIIKMAFMRGFRKIEILEDGINKINTTIAAISVKIDDLVHLKNDHITLEKQMIALSHEVKDCNEEHKKNSSDLSSLRDRLEAIERQIDRLLSKARMSSSSTKSK